MSDRATKLVLASTNFQAGLAPTQEQFEVQLDMWQTRTKLTLRVAPSGTTESAELNPALPDALAKCITDHARAAGFAPVDSAKPRIIVVPITFVAAQ